MEKHDAGRKPLQGEDGLQTATGSLTEGAQAAASATAPATEPPLPECDGQETEPPAFPLPLEQRPGPRLAPQEALLDATCAFDCLARRTMLAGKSGLNKAQADIIMHIALFGPSSMSSLALGLAMSKEHVTRTVSALEERGVVTKRRRPDNHRVVEAMLTEEGVRLTTSIRKAAIARLDDPLSSLSPAERDELVTLTTRVAELLRKVRLA